MQSVLQRRSEPVTDRFPAQQPQMRRMKKLHLPDSPGLAKRAAPLGWKLKIGNRTTGTTLWGTSQISQPNPSFLFCVLCASADRLLNP